MQQEAVDSTYSCSQSILNSDDVFENLFFNKDGDSGLRRQKRKSMTQFLLFRSGSSIHRSLISAVCQSSQTALGESGNSLIFGEYAEGLMDIDGFSHLLTIYAFHRCPSYHLTVRLFLDPTPRGVFATRAPRRPNAIGLSIVRLTDVKGTTLLRRCRHPDRTPLLDLKPYVPLFDAYPDASSGWLEPAHMVQDRTVRMIDSGESLTTAQTRKMDACERFLYLFPS